MYFIDLFKRILRKSNISLIIYLILNVLIISGCSALVFYSSNVPVPVGLLIGAVLYALSLAVALSPFGEWLLRLQTGCKKSAEPITSTTSCRCFVKYTSVHASLTRPFPQTCSYS